MRRKAGWVGLAVLSAILSACAPAADRSLPTQPVTLIPTIAPQPGRGASTEAPIDAEPSLTRSDNQGAIEITVTPVDLREESSELVFEVSLNTHSVDLSMDLAAAARIETDTGLSWRAARWEAPRGGHHVSGRLVFSDPANGGPLLRGASRLTLTLVGVDAPERRFTWDLPS